MTQCIHHPQYEAIESCEHCHVPLCGICLWYAESGERLCKRCAKEREAAGQVVYPPEEYAEGIQPVLSQPARSSVQQAPYSGNSIDMAGLAAACLGAMILLSCVPCLNVVVPLLAVPIGIFALVEARRAVEPRRTQLLAGVGIASGALVALPILGWFALSLGMPIVMLLIEAITQQP